MWRVSMCWERTSTAVPGYERQQRVGVPRAADDLVPGVLEQAGEALAQQHGVLGDHDAHGSSTAIRVPAPAGLSSASDPPWAATRSAIPASPEPAPGDAPPTPSSLTTSRSTPLARAACTDTRDGAPCLTALVIASQAMK